MAMNISCKFEKASYNIFFVRAVTVKSLYTLQWQRRRRNKVKFIVSTGCYPVDTINGYLVKAIQDIFVHNTKYLLYTFAVKHFLQTLPSVD